MKKLLLSLLSFLLLLFPNYIWGQGCSVCTQTAAGLGAHSAEGLNAGILYLAALPLIFMITVAVIWWKRNKSASLNE